MKEYHVEFETKRDFLIKRDKEILAVIIFPDKTILVSRKDHYPKDVYRLTTGGIKKNEKPEEALKREIYEETGITEMRFKPLALINYKIKNGKCIKDYQTYAYVVNVEEQNITVMDPDENISDFKRVNIREFQNLTKILGSLKLIDKSETPWDEWGKFRKIAHDITIELIE